MINVGGQRPNIGGNWQLTGPYLQRCNYIPFFDNFTLQFGIFRNKFLVNLHHSLEKYDAWKGEEPIWSKTEILLTKKCKIWFLSRFWAILRLSQQFYCKIYVYDVTPSWFLFWWYLYSLAFSDKKIKFQKFCPCGILCPWNGNKILRFCNWYGFWHQIDFELNVIDAWFSP